MFKYGFVLKDRDFIKSVMVVAIPMILQQLITSSVNLLDNLMVGQLGEFAIAGVATSNKYFMISLFAMMGVVSASTIYLAQYYGAKKELMMKQSFRFGLIHSVIIVLFFSSMAWLFPRQIIAFFADNDGLMEAAIQYMPIAAFTFIPQALSFTIASSLRAIGETKKPLVSSIISLSMNVVMNYVFIFGHFGFPALGIVGAALGTLIARILELTYLVMVLYRNDYGFTTNLNDLFKIDSTLRKNITLKAIPLLLNEIGWSAGMALLFKFYATRGETALAALPIASTTSDLFFVLFSGMAVATVVMVSHPLGSNQLDKARENGYKMLQLAILLSLIFAVGLFGASFITPNLYNVSDEIRHMAANLIRVQGLFFFIYMHNAQSFFVIRAGGDTRSTLIMDSGYMWFINLPVVAYFAYFTDVNIFMVFIAGQLTDILKLLVTSYYFRKEHWVKNLTTHDGELQVN